MPEINDISIFQIENSDILNIVVTIINISTVINSFFVLSNDNVKLN